MHTFMYCFLDTGSPFANLPQPIDEPVFSWCVASGMAWIAAILQRKCLFCVCVCCLFTVCALSAPLVYVCVCVWG